jgi:biopolymer transport protein ExbD
MKFRRTVEIEKGRRLEITPLIDVVLLLLIFFMLTSSFVFNPGIKVNIPEYSSAENIRPTDLVVTITKSNEVFFKGKYMSQIDNFRQLKLELQKAARETKDPRLIIEADIGVPFGKVVDIMSLAMDEGLYNQAIATRPKEEME